MYRQSSKGNPWHDARGRFTTSGGANLSKAEGVKQGLVEVDKDGNITDDKRPVTWSSFEDQQNVKGMSDKKLRKLDTDKTNEHMNSGERIYHKHSISREKHAISVSQFQIPKGLSTPERKEYYNKCEKEFYKENKHAIDRGGIVVPFRKGNSNSFSFQIVESARITYSDDIVNNGYVTRNTSSSMKIFHGYTVECNDDKEIRSCKKDANGEDIRKAIDKYCNKHKEAITKGNVLIRVYREPKDGRIRLAPSYYFETEADAKAFASKNSKKYTIVNQDDGSQA